MSRKEMAQLAFLIASILFTATKAIVEYELSKGASTTSMSYRDDCDDTLY